MEAVLCQFGFNNWEFVLVGGNPPPGGGDSVMNCVGSSMLVLMVVDKQTVQ
jgi:hypothetical protein